MSRPPATAPTPSGGSTATSSPPTGAEFDVEEVTDAALLRKQREVQALLAWSNAFLSKRNLNAASLYGFDNGVLLINLLEEAFNEVVSKYNARPKNPIHKLENVSIAFDTMKKHGIVLVSIDTHDVVGRKDKQITNVLWNILRQHLLRAIKSDTGDKGTANNPNQAKQTIKDKLLQWCRTTFADQPKIEINDFWESFKSGVALTAIVNKLHPGAIDPSTIDTKDPIGTLARAIKAAEQHLGIPALLDAEDFKSNVPDEGTVVNYLSMLLSAAHTSEKAKELTDRLAAEKAAREAESKEERKLVAVKQDEINKLKDQLIELKVTIEQGEVKQGEWKEKFEDKCKEVVVVEKKVKEIVILREEDKKTQEQTETNYNKEKQEILQKQEEMKGEIHKWKDMLEKMTDTAQITKALADDETKRREEEKKDHDGEIEKLHKNINDLKDKIKQIEKEKADELAKKDEEIQGLNNEIQSLKDKSRQDHNDWAAAKGKLELEIQEKMNRIAELEASLEGANKTISAKLGEIATLRSEVYSLHTELEELVERVKKEEREKQSELEREEKYSDKKAADKKVIVPRDMTNPKFLSDALEGMKAFGGVLMRRRPFAVFNATRFKEVFFRIRGEILEWGKDDKHIKNNVKLKDYVPGVVKSTSPGQFMFRLTPAKSDGNVVFDFMAPKEQSDNTDKYIKAWLYQINRRISLIEYLASSSEKKLPVVEFVNFLCDDRLQSLSCKEIIHGVPEALGSLNPALKFRNNLKKVELCNCNLQDKDMSHVSDLLKENNAVLYLDLSHNLMTQEGASALASVLALQNQTLKSLIVDNNQLKDNGCQRLAQILPSHPKMHELSLNGNQITDLGVISFCNELLASEKKNNGQVHQFPEIRLKGNKIGDKGGEALALLLRRNPSIKSINLEHNSVGDVGAIAIVKVLGDPAVNTETSKLQLNTINFSNNHLSTKACVAVAEVMKLTGNALSLDLSYNKLISRQGVKALVSVDVPIDYPLLKLVKHSADGDEEDEDEQEKKKKEKEALSTLPSASPSAAASRETSANRAKAAAGDDSDGDTPPEGSRKDDDEHEKKK